MKKKRIFKSVELLKEYFRSVPKEEIEALWKNVQAMNFKVPTVKELLKSISKTNKK